MIFGYQFADFDETELPVGKARIEIRNSGAPALVRDLTLNGGETIRIKHKF